MRRMGFKKAIRYHYTVERIAKAADTEMILASLNDPASFGYRLRCVVDAGDDLLVFFERPATKDDFFEESLYPEH